MWRVCNSLVLRLTVSGLLWALATSDNHADSESSWELCKLDRDRGELCLEQYTIRWFYNETDGRCARFWYGGCMGNGNNFENEELCNDRCKHTKGTGECRMSESLILSYSRNRSLDTIIIIFHNICITNCFRQAVIVQ